MNKQTKIEVPEGLALLRQPFAAHHIGRLPKPTKKQTDDVRNDYKKGIRCEECGQWHHPDVVHLDYVGHAALTDRLLDVDPHWNWEPQARDEYGAPLLDPNGGLWINLTVCGVTRPGYGDAQGKTGGNAVKEAIGDALRNAAMRFGAALDLWHKGELHVEEVQEGQSQEGAVSPSAPAKGWREPDSPLSTPTKLHKELSRLDRELQGCGDSDMVYGLTATDEWKEFVKIAEKYSPHYLHGGEPAPEEFEGLLVKAARLVAEFDTQTADEKARLATA